MSDRWTISDSVAALVSKGVAQYVANVGEPDFPYCPILIWSLGGELREAGGGRHAVPPRYELGIARRADIAEQGFVAIADARVGLLAFSPKPADAASGRRLIDFDGTDIVVR